MVAHAYSLARHEFVAYARPPLTPTIPNVGDFGRVLEHCGYETSYPVGDGAGFFGVRAAALAKAPAPSYGTNAIAGRAMPTTRPLVRTAPMSKRNLRATESHAMERPVGGHPPKTPKRIDRAS